MGSKPMSGSLLWTVNGGSHSATLWLWVWLWLWFVMRTHQAISRLAMPMSSCSALWQWNS